MKCLTCHVDKLSNEFPPTTITDVCDHPSLICLRCVTTYVEQEKSCPHPDCKETVDAESQNLKWFNAILKEMFSMYDTTSVPTSTLLDDSTGTITVTVLNGETQHVPYLPNMTVTDLKKKIQDKLGHEFGKQKLLYNDQALQVYKSDGECAKLSDYAVQPDSTVHLVVLLYAIPEEFDHVVFDLSWGFPTGGMDCLDASCLVFQGNTLLATIDYNEATASEDITSAIEHSGDVMEYKKKIGHQKIQVHLKKIPNQVTHLFFTLSAFYSQTLSKFRDPTLKFYTAAQPDKDLCKTTFVQALSSQAVVMCSVSRSKEGSWDIYESGISSAGNAMDYKSLERTVSSLIAKGF